jgi:hypothetical protein
MYGGIVAGLGGIFTFLFALAAFSRIATMPQAPQLIKDAAQAFVSLFNGAFDL